MPYRSADLRYMYMKSVDRMFLKQAETELAEESKQNKPTQPPKCVGCPWGRWEGSHQFCIRIQCVKGDSRK